MTRPLARQTGQGPDEAASHGLAGTSALGPVDAFGLAALQAGAAAAGLERVDA